MRSSTSLVSFSLIALLDLFLALLVVMNRRSPYTSEAALKAPVIGIAANVSGDIVEVGVRDNQRVKAGDLPFQIGQALFEAAQKAADARLQYVIQTLDAEATGLGAAEAAVVQADARLEEPIFP